MEDYKRQLLMLAFLVLALVSAVWTVDRSTNVVDEMGVNVPVKGKKRIVVDAGHGGRDGGKVGEGNILEKDINLKIAMYLKAELKDAGYEVFMIRETDMGLYKERDGNKKRADLKARCDKINEVKPACSIGIHQNSFPSANAKGAQVFYYAKSEEGKRLAEAIQSSMVDGLDSSNKRKIKTSDDYYMLLHTDSPGVIVECGFLSNPEEAAKLSDTDYQKKAAKAICQGVENYFKTP